MPKRQKESDRLTMKFEKTENSIRKRLCKRVKVFTDAEKLSYCRAYGLEIVGGEGRKGVHFQAQSGHMGRLIS